MDGIEWLAFYDRRRSGLRLNELMEFTGGMTGAFWVMLDPEGF
jgi:hypothetical protein